VIGMGESPDLTLRVSEERNRPRLLYTARLLLREAGAHRLLVREDPSGEAGLRVSGRLLVGEGELLRLFGRVSLLDEIDGGLTDELGRLLPGASTGDPLDPCVSRRACDLAKELRESGISTADRPASLRVFFTHDIDRTTGLEPTAFLKYLAHRLGLSPSPFPAPLPAGSRCPFLATLEAIMAMEREAGVAPWFFFLSGPYRPTRHGSRYDIRWPSARAMLRAAKAGGGVIGLHGSYAARERGSYAAEAARLRESTGEPAIIHRNHYLRFDPVRLWSHLETAGITHDSSVGYRDRMGFRCGVAGPFRPYDLMAEGESPVVEVPLVYMDRREHLDRPEEALESLRRLLSTAKELGGGTALLFHPENFLSDERWFSFFEKVIRLCRELGAELSHPLPTVPA